MLTNACSGPLPCVRAMAFRRLGRTKGLGRDLPICKVDIQGGSCGNRFRTQHCMMSKCSSRLQLRAWAGRPLRERVTQPAFRSQVGKPTTARKVRALLKFTEPVKGRGRQGLGGHPSSPVGMGRLQGPGLEGTMTGRGPPPRSHVTFSQCPMLTGPVGNPSPWVMLYQETVASPGQVPAAQAPPASGHRDRVGGARSSEDPTRRGCKIKVQAPQQQQR